MNITELLDSIWLGNTVSHWLIAVGVFFAVIVGLWPLKKLVLNRLRVFAASTDTDFDDLILKVIQGTKFVIVLVIAAWAGTRVLVLPKLILNGFETLAIIVGVLQVGIWATTWLTGWLKIIGEKRAEDGEAITWLRGVEWAGKLVIWAVALLIGMENLGVDVTGLIAGLGIGGIAVALAAQNILGDLFAAFSIFVDKPFLIGDSLTIGEQTGTVESIGVKTTRLRSLSGEQLIFGNSDLVKSRIQNFGRLYQRRVAFTVSVTYDTPRQQVEAIPTMIQEIVEGQDQVRFDRAHFKELGDSALIFEAIYHVLVPSFQTKMDVQQAINLELMRRFEAEGIEFAFPTQSIFLENVAPSDTAAQGPA